MALYAFDGTWNVRDRKNSIEKVQHSQYGDDPIGRRETVETNVHRFREFFGPDRTEYLQGVGTRFSWLGRVFGGIFGAGGKRRIRSMYRSLNRRFFESNDRDIDIIGFSRGSAMAVHFANVIAKYGLRHPENRKHLTWWYYPALGWTFRHPKVGPKDVKNPKIRFLGLWETVASFGLPIRPFRNRLKQWLVDKVPVAVARSFHAMALDEVRSTFSLVRPTSTDPKRHYELWFRGVHSNVGGGYLDRGLSDIALAWMMEMYIWTLEKEGGTPPPRFKEALRMTYPEPGTAPDWSGTTLETLEPDPNGDLGRPPDIHRQAWRDLPLKALVHHSVFQRNPNLVSDHYRSNRRLLRRIPKDALTVYDPPFFHCESPRQAAEKLAVATFAHAPVRAQDWLVIDNQHIFRSDHWIAVGQNRDNFVHGTCRKSFEIIATEWILAGRPSNAIQLKLPSKLPNHLDEPVDSAEMADWVLRVLKCLESYMPAMGELEKPDALPGMTINKGE
jgi:hypothetical protein